jgi:hypothetical protein
MPSQSGGAHVSSLHWPSDVYALYTFKVVAFGQQTQRFALANLDDAAQHLAIVVDTLQRRNRHWRSKPLVTQRVHIASPHIRTYTHTYTYTTQTQRHYWLEEWHRSERCRADANARDSRATPARDATHRQPSSNERYKCALLQNIHSTTESTRGAHDWHIERRPFRSEAHGTRQCHRHSETNYTHRRALNPEPPHTHTQTASAHWFGIKHARFGFLVDVFAIVARNVGFLKKQAHCIGQRFHRRLKMSTNDDDNIRMRAARWASITWRTRAYLCKIGRLQSRMTPQTTQANAD